MNVRTRVRIKNHFGNYSNRLPGAARRLTLRLARYGRAQAAKRAPVDTGALRESMYVIHNGLDERDTAFVRAMGRLERAKRQYIAYHKRGGPRMGFTRTTGRSRRPHTTPEQMFPKRMGAGVGHRGSFGMPAYNVGPYHAQVVAGMYYAPHVEYPTRKRSGRYYMRAASNAVLLEAGNMVNDMLKQVFR